MPRNVGAIMPTRVNLWETENWLPFFKIWLSSANNSDNDAFKNKGKTTLDSI